MTIDYPDFIKSLIKQTLNATSLGRNEEAIILLKVVETEYIENNKKEFLGSTYSAIGEAYRQLGDRRNAIIMFKKSCDACRMSLKQPGAIDEFLLKQNLRSSLGNLADLTRESGDLSSALPIYEEMEKIAMSLNEMHWIQASLSNQGFIHFQLNRNESAIKVFKKQENICRKEGNEEDLVKCLYFQALIYKKIEEFNNFIFACTQIIDIHEQTQKYPEFVNELEKLGYFSSFE